MKEFQIVGGTVPGTDHTKPGMPSWKNNQDAFVWRVSPELLVGVICDGCGSTPHAEVGAKVGANLVCQALTLCMDEGVRNALPLEEILNNAARSVVQIIEACAETMGGDAAQQVLEDYFLFTIMGVLITPKEAVVFSRGDGVFAVNGDVRVIPPFPDNAPPYLTYACHSLGLVGHIPEFTVLARLPTEDVDSILIGSDGCADLLEAAEVPLPGREEHLGSFLQFITDEKYMTNPDAIRRRLALANREWAEGGHIHKGLLPDDTTMLVVRRNTQPE